MVTVSDLLPGLLYVYRYSKNVTPATQTITVTFKKNEAADGGPVVDTRTYTVGEKYDPLPTVSRTGYSFNGWWPEKDSKTNEYKSTTTVTVTWDHYLYAHWTPLTYQLKLYRNDGTGTYETKQITYGSTYGTTLASITRTGYTFQGWYTAASGGSKVESTAQVTGAATLYAHWTANTYTVTLNNNDGTNVSKR